MAKYNRINWQTGMEVTPEVLIDSDNFQIEQQNIIGRLRAMPYYGLLPESDFNADIRMNGNHLSITNLVIQAITSQGEIIDINGQNEEYKIDLSQYNDSTLYVALNYNDTAFPEKDTFCVTADPAEETSAVVIAKISDNIVDTNYIPPCVSINSHSRLLENFEDIKQKIEYIMTQVEGQDRYKSIFLHLLLLELELKNYSAFETPANLFLAVKKMASIFKFTVNDVPGNIERLSDEIYCHTEIYDMIYVLLDALCEMEEMTQAPIEAPKIQKIQIAVK